MLGRSRSGRAMPNTQLFLLSSIAAYTVRSDPTVSCLAIAAGSLADEAAIVRELDWPPFIGSFWHESSATEPSGTARDGRAREPRAANLPAMPVAGGVAVVSLPEAGRGQCRGSCDHGADRSAVSGPALLWLAPDGGMAGDPRPSRQSQAGAAPDAAAGTGGDLPAPQHEQAGASAQDLPVPARRARHRAGQSGLVLGRHVHPDGQGVPLFGGDHGLGQPRGAGVAAVQHARRRFLRRGPRGSALAPWPAGNLQYRPREPVHQ